VSRERNKQEGGGGIPGILNAAQEDGLEHARGSLQHVGARTCLGRRRGSCAVGIVWHGRVMCATCAAVPTLWCGAVRCVVCRVECVKRMKKLRVRERGCFCFALLCLPYGPVHIASRLTMPPRIQKRTARLRLQPRYIALHYLHLRSHYTTPSNRCRSLHLPTQHHQPPGSPTQYGWPKEKGAVSVVCPPSSCSSSHVVPAFSRPFPVARHLPYPTIPT
jgi:hypothetical protein